MAHAQRATCAWHVVKMTWRREDVILAVITAFFCLQEPNLKSGRIVVVIRILMGKLVEDGSPICRNCEKKVGARGGNTSNLLTFTLRPSPSTVQRMEGKLTSSLCA